MDSEGAVTPRAAGGHVASRWPRAEAVAVARHVCRQLAPVCTRLIVAGSLRRRRAEVGDVEILYIPKFQTEQADMFATTQANLVDRVLGGMLASGEFAKRPNCNGGFAWGEKNKLALHRSGIPVDLFTASESNWWNYLVCRTGGAESNIRIAQAAIQRGWKWNPYGDGFSRGGALAGPAESHTVHSEREVFEFVGLPYLEPWQR